MTIIVASNKPNRRASEERDLAVGLESFILSILFDFYPFTPQKSTSAGE
jgi:hypothetical protein